MANISNFFQDYWLPSSNHPDATTYSSNLARDDIQYLYQKLSKFSRTTTQWDLYKISEVITDKESYLSQINSLVPYSSAIIGTRFTDEKGISYNVGDLIYKNLDQSTTHIVAERGGVFQPQKLELVEGQTLKLTFEYLPQEPIGEAQTKLLDVTPITQPADSSIYGHAFDVSTTHSTDWFPIITSTPPIIKMYDKNNEEVYYDYALSLDSSTNKYAISNIPTIITKVVVK